MLELNISICQPPLLEEMLYPQEDAVLPLLTGVFFSKVSTSSFANFSATVLSPLTTRFNHVSNESKDPEDLMLATRFSFLGLFSTFYNYSSLFF